MTAPCGDFTASVPADANAPAGRLRLMLHIQQPCWGEHLFDLFAVVSRLDSLMQLNSHDAATVILADLSRLLNSIALARHVSAAATIWLPIRLPIRSATRTAAIWLLSAAIWLPIRSATSAASIGLLTIWLLTVPRRTEARPATHSSLDARHFWLQSTPGAQQAVRRHRRQGERTAWRQRAGCCTPAQASPWH